MSYETKEARFKRLAKQRAERAIKDIQLLGNLSNRNNYSYSDSDVKKIFSALEDELRITKNQFSVKKKREIRF